MGAHAVTAWLDTSPMQFRTIDGLSIRFAESEGRAEHALLLSPWLESLLACGASSSAVRAGILGEFLPDESGSAGLGIRRDKS